MTKSEIKSPKVIPVVSVSITPVVIASPPVHKLVTPAAVIKAEPSVTSPVRIKRVTSPATNHVVHHASNTLKTKRKDDDAHFNVNSSISTYKAHSNDITGYNKNSASTFEQSLLNISPPDENYTKIILEEKEILKELLNDIEDVILQKDIPN